jgi:hypothetical protein
LASALVIVGVVMIQEINNRVTSDQ